MTRTTADWEREYFKLAAFMLSCKLSACNGEPDRIGVLMGEMDYSSEMGRVLEEARTALFSRSSRTSRSSRSMRQSISLIGSAAGG
jgi:hypothetical protein